MTDAVDLFGGPGGWDVAARELGIDPLGIEWDDAACATRAAAGLRTLQADVAALTPQACDLVLGGPPCPPFSMAGKGEGRRALAAYADAIDAMASGHGFDVEALDRACDDPRGHLVLEPLRWVLAVRPRWVACEQVPPVLPLWERMAAALRAHGYHTWTGLLRAEQYGVPQTRERAFLMASTDGPVSRPSPTHARYVAPRRRAEQELGLFDAPEPERIVRPEDRHLRPWVSMAEALGWTEDATVGFPRAADDGVATEDGYRARDFRPATEPAFNLTEKARSWTLRTGNFTAIARDPDGKRSRAGSMPYERPASEPAPTIATSPGEWALRAGTNDHDVTRSSEEPAPTLRFGARLNAVEWKLRAAGQANAAVRDASEPSPTIIGGHDTANRVWTTGDRQNGYAVRVSEAEAAVLQGFPPDYPWQGSQSKRFQQIGNAVPPPLARAVLEALVR